MGTGSSTGDGGIAVRALALGKEVRIYESGDDIHDNHVGDIRVKPDNAGRVYLNDIEVSNVGGGQLNGFGKVFDCFEPEDAQVSG